MQIKLKKLLRENKAFLIFLLLMFSFRSAVADWNIVPSGSMLPTIEVGDRIWVNKLAYDIQVPFLYISLYHRADPQRGDIVVFESKVSDLRLIKRVVGVPGDIVELRNNQVWINGESLSYTLEKNSNTDAVYTEVLGKVKHRIRLSKVAPSDRSTYFSTPVPEGFYFVLGDNRDNSNDSRYIGFVPRDEIIGRSSSVVMSHDFDNYYLPKKGRFFKSL